MSFDAMTNTISIVRGDDRVIIFTIDNPPPWIMDLTDMVSGTFTARDRADKVILASDLVEIVDQTTVRVTLTHFQTTPQGVYLADLELRFPGGPTGPDSDDPYAGLLVYTPWTGRLALGIDQTREP